MYRGRLEWQDMVAELTDEERPPKVSLPRPTIINQILLGDRAVLEVRVAPDSLRALERARGGAIEVHLVADDSLT